MDDDQGSAFSAQAIGDFNDPARVVGKPPGTHVEIGPRVIN
jgi:hypothetical protein